MPWKNDKRRQANKNSNVVVSKLDEGEHVHFLDIRPKLLRVEGTLSHDFMPDLLHLSANGYTIWAGSIEEKLVQFLGAK